MKKMLLISASALGLLSVAASAGQPEDPGGFGRDRAAGVKAAIADPTAPGASEWGHEAARRGSTNGELNRQWREDTGGVPSHGNDGEEDGEDDDTME